jgi:hypothetical protein
MKAILCSAAKCQAARLLLNDSVAFTQRLVFFEVIILTAPWAYSVMLASAEHPLPKSR